MKVSDAVSSMFELKGWSMADFIPHAANQEVPYNIFLGVLQGNVIDLRPRMAHLIVIVLTLRRWNCREASIGYAKFSESARWRFNQIRSFARYVNCCIC